MPPLTAAEEEKLIRLEREEAVYRARRGLLSFTLYTKLDSEGKPDYRVSWHHRRTAKALNAWVDGPCRFLMLLEPPRHGKSELASRRLPAYLHGRFPDDELMAASYSSSLADDMTADVQRIMDSPEYQRVFPHVRIPPPGTRDALFVRNSEEHHIVGRRGKYRGQGVGGSFVGKGAKRIVIDDPIKGHVDANSPAFRDKLWKWYLNDLRSRLAGDGRILLIGTHWHEDDLFGRILEKQKADPLADQFQVIRLAAIREDMDDPEDPRKMGEALWPEQVSLTELRAIRANDVMDFQALYQQSPVPRSGGFFQQDMFEFGPCPEEFDWSFAVGDSAYTDKQQSDFSVLTHFGMVGKQLYINAVYREQIKAAHFEAAAVAFLKPLQVYGFRGAWIEPKGHGIYLNQALPRQEIMVPGESEVAAFFKDRKLNKPQRASNSVPYLAGKKVVINENIRNKEALLAELLSFPKAKHDDFTDTVIDGVKLAYAREQSILDVL